MFVRRAGTLILASMILVWALLYFPVTAPDGMSYDLKVALQGQKDEVEEKLEALQKQQTPSDEQRAEIADLGKELVELAKKIGPEDKTVKELQSEWKGQSILGRVGKAVEPAVAPLGWDWRIGMAAIASFPAREVMVGTLGIIFNEGEGDAGEEEFRTELGNTLGRAAWENEPSRKLFTVPVALSVMVFFALCCQCVSTLAVIRRETNSWTWPAFTFVYMTALAYLGALAVYQVGRFFT
jgi:ferrous iron transport protein B